MKFWKICSATEKGKVMPSFMVKNPLDISDFMIPVTPEQAVTMTDWVVKKEINGELGSGRGYFAVWGPDMYGKTCVISLRISPTHFEGKWWYHVVTDEYHPRKDGKADIEFNKPARKTASKKG